MNKFAYAVLFIALIFLSCEQKSLEEGDSLLSYLGLADADKEAPVVTEFSGPDTTGESTVPVNITATDNVRVTGWMITETATPPLPDSPGWLTTQPVSYAITSGYGTYELYLWARDRAGNISALSAETHFAIIYAGTGDGTPPVVSYFAYTCTNPTNSPVIPVDITATDDVGVTGYIITESAVTPDLADPGWSAVQPATYTIASGFGTFELYVWARDLAGNVSLASASTHFSITYNDTTSPTVTVNQAASQTADPTNTLPIEFTVTFSEEINPVTFAVADITQGGTASGITWALSTSDNITWTLQATAVSGAGTLVPSIAASMVQDPAGNPNMASSSADNSVTYDATPPTVTVNQAASQIADPTNTLPIEFTVTFSEEINPATFTVGDITQGGTASGITWALSTSNNITWTLQATAVVTSGTLVPSIAASRVQDLAGNNNANSTSADNSVTYDATTPTVTVNQAASQIADPTNTLPIEFTVTFSEEMNPATFTVGDINQGGTASGITWTLSTSNNIDWTLRATAVSGAGTLIPSIAASMVQDLAGNNNGASTSTDNTVSYDVTSPAVTVNQAAAQTDDPDSVLPIEFTIAFNEAINPATFTVGDITQGGTASGIVWTLSTGDNVTWTLQATAVSSPGTLVPSLAANQVQDLAGNNNTASTSTDNSVAYTYYAQVIQTGQINCYDEGGAAVACAGTGQDGELQMGLPWNPATRFTVGAQTFTDNLTGLVWVNDASASGMVSWDNAFAYVDSLNMSAYGGRNDWRLPNIVELMSLMNFGNSNITLWFSGLGITVPASFYWSSTTYYQIWSDAWMFGITTGTKGNTAKGNTFYAWPVAGSSTVLPRTGQTSCYNSSGVSIACAGTGQDGELQRGVAWPAPRFINHGDGTVTDNLTGLMWAEDANDMASTYPSFDLDAPLGNGVVTWQHALDYVAMLNGVSYLGYNDWRLPNSFELLSLEHQGYNLDWLTDSGFVNANTSTQVFWTSTSSESDTTYAGVVNTVYGSTGNHLKTFINYYTWPVRGGN